MKILRLIFILFFLLPSICIAEEKLNTDEKWSYERYRRENKEVIEYVENWKPYQNAKLFQETIQKYTSLKKDFSETTLYDIRFVEIKAEVTEIDYLKAGIYSEILGKDIQLVYNTRNEVILLIQWRW